MVNKYIYFRIMWERNFYTCFLMYFSFIKRLDFSEREYFIYVLFIKGRRNEMISLFEKIVSK